MVTSRTGRVASHATSAPMSPWNKNDAPSARGSKLRTPSSTGASTGAAATTRTRRADVDASSSTDPSAMMRPSRMTAARSQ